MLVCRDVSKYVHIIFFKKSKVYFLNYLGGAGGIVQCLKRPEEGIRFSGDGGTAYCELSHMGPENQIHVLCRNSKHYLSSSPDT